MEKPQLWYFIEKEKNIQMCPGELKTKQQTEGQEVVGVKNFTEGYSAR